MERFSTNQLFSQMTDTTFRMSTNSPFIEPADTNPHYSHISCLFIKANSNGNPVLSISATAEAIQDR